MDVGRKGEEILRDHISGHRFFVDYLRIGSHGYWCICYFRKICVLLLAYTQWLFKWSMILFEIVTSAEHRMRREDSCSLWASHCMMELARAARCWARRWWLRFLLFLVAEVSWAPLLLLGCWITVWCKPSTAFVLGDVCELQEAPEVKAGPPGVVGNTD